MALTLGDLFQNWSPDTNLPTEGATVDGGVVDMMEPNLFIDKVMQPGITYATDVESLMVDERFAAAYIRKLDKIKVTKIKATDDGAFRVVPTMGDGEFILIECNDVLKVAEVTMQPIDVAKVSGRTADKVALAAQCYDEIKELTDLSYLINGGGSADPTDTGAPASANTVASTKENIVDNIINDRAILRKAGAQPDTLILSVDTEALLLQKVSDKIFYRSPSDTELVVLGSAFAGTIFSGKVRVFTSNAIGQDVSELVGEEAESIEWNWENIEYILYDHKTLCIVNVARFLGLVDYSAFYHNSTLISLLTVCGGRVRNTQKAIAKMKAA